jgi:hypothetical protein
VNKGVLFAAVILIACILVEALSTGDLKAGLLDDHAGHMRLKGYADAAVKEPGDAWRDQLVTYVLGVHGAPIWRVVSCAVHTGPCGYC